MHFRPQDVDEAVAVDLQTWAREDGDCEHADGVGGFAVYRALFDELLDDAFGEVAEQEDEDARSSCVRAVE